MSFCYSIIILINIKLTVSRQQKQVITVIPHCSCWIKHCPDMSIIIMSNVRHQYMIYMTWCDCAYISFRQISGKRNRFYFLF